MIPVSVHPTNFRTFHEGTPEITLENIDSAVITGGNGRGKSSIIDAWLWAYFGEGRHDHGARMKPDEETITDNGAQAMTVVAKARTADGSLYRATRGYRRTAKTSTPSLEFAILDEYSTEETWTDLTADSVAETQKVILRAIGIDYETLINSSFFLQGEWDNFTTSAVSDRQNVFGKIVGAHIYLDYEDEAINRHKKAKKARVNHEERMEALRPVADGLSFAMTASTTADNALAARQVDKKEADQALIDLNAELAKIAAAEMALEPKREAVTDSNRLLGRLGGDLGTAKTSLDTIAATIDNAYVTENEFIEYEDIERRLKEVDAKIPVFHRIKGEIAAIGLALQTEKVRLESVRTTGRNADTEIELLGKAIDQDKIEIVKLEDRNSMLPEAREALDSTEKKGAELRKKETEKKLIKNQIRDKIAGIENDIINMRALEDAECPTCRQDLSEQHKTDMIAQWEKTKEEYVLADSFGLRELEEIDHLIQETLRAHSSETAYVKLTDCRDKIDLHKMTLEKWKKERKALTDLLEREVEVSRLLTDETYLPEEREKLAALQLALETLDYSVESSQPMRDRFEQIKTAPQRKLDLGRAREAHQPALAKVDEMNKELSAAHGELATRQAALTAAEAESTAATDRKHHAQAELQQAVLKAERLEVELRGLYTDATTAKATFKRALGAADDLEELTDSLVQAKKEERIFGALRAAFGKNGIPALIIDDAIPEVEERANVILQTLMGGRYELKINTLRAKKAGGTLETFDIRLTHGDGHERTYQSLSGGQQFRVNFAIRIALSLLLAERKGISVRTLVIDEGFGSQDDEGLAAIVDSLHKVHDLFEMILVVTHVEAMKNAFDTEIHVEWKNKTNEDDGATATIIRH